MKTNMKLKLAATAAAVLASGLLSQNAKANLVGVDTPVTLYQDGGTGQFTVESIALFPGENDAAGVNPSSTEYLYYYQFGVNYPTPPVPIDSVSVYFDTTGTVDGVNGTPGTAPNGGIHINVPTTDVNWQFGDGISVGHFDFFSMYAPTLGLISAQDGGLWGASLASGGGEAFGVVVPGIPSVPDSATTLSLLGGALVGLGALRRKIGC